MRLTYGVRRLTDDVTVDADAKVSAGVAGTAQGIVAEAVLRSEDEDLGLEHGVGLVKCTAEVSLGYRR
jgi:hypothetical protein